MFIKQKIFIIFFSLFFIAVPAVNVEVIAQDDLTILKTNDEQYRTGTYRLGDIFNTLVRGTDYLFGIVGAVALLAFIMGGVILLISSGNQEMVTKGRSILVNSTIGLAIVFSGYITVDYVLEKIEYDKSEFGEWAEIPAEAEIKFPASAVDSATGVVGGDVSKIQDLVSQGKIILDTKGSCGRENNPQKTMDEIAAGGSITVCSHGCSSASGCEKKAVTVSKELLSSTSNVAKAHGLVITSITTGSHIANSLHYSGEAIDTVLISSDYRDWDNAVRMYNEQGLCAKCEVPTGFPGCSGMFSGGSRKSGAHIHVTTGRC